MLVDPIDVGELVGDRFRTPTAEKDRSAHRLAVILRRIVREQKASPEVLRILPISSAPAHQHNARRANLFSGMEQQMGLHHAAFQGDGLSVVRV